jgi:hypothetical protein
MPATSKRRGVYLAFPSVNEITVKETRPSCPGSTASIFVVTAVTQNPLPKGE